MASLYHRLLLSAVPGSEGQRAGCTSVPYRARGSDRARHYRVGRRTGAPGSAQCDAKAGYGIVVMRSRSSTDALPSRRASSLPPHILCLLVIPQRHEPAVPKVLITRPFDELKLRHQHRLQPPAFAHLGRRQSSAPASGLLLRQIRERAILDFQRLNLLEQLSARDVGVNPLRVRAAYIRLGPS